MSQFYADLPVCLLKWLGTLLPWVHQCCDDETGKFGGLRPRQVHVNIKGRIGSLEDVARYDITLVV